VRHRARPSFTVEIKRANKRSPLIVAEAAERQSETQRRANALLFGELAVAPESPVRAPEPRSAPAEAPWQAEAEAQPRPVRILPDLSRIDAVDALQRQEAEERTARRRAPRRSRTRQDFADRNTVPSNAIMPDLQEQESTDFLSPSMDGRSAEIPLRRAQADEPEIQAPQQQDPASGGAELAAANEPAPAVEAPEPATAGQGSTGDAAPEHAAARRGGRNKRYRAACRRAMRRGRPLPPLPAGQRWKRRLPVMCR
jgi:hypothetical protein